MLIDNCAAATLGIGPAYGRQASGKAVDSGSRGRGENCLWQFARKSSDGNLSPVVKFRARQR